MVRYEQIITLRKQGMKNADIATQMGMAERTVRQWLTRGSIPHSRSRRQRAQLIDPYKTYLLERWNQGCHNGVQLERELKAKGYKGSQRGMYRYASDLGTIGIPARETRFCSNKHTERFLRTVQSTPDPLWAAGHVALFPKESRLEGRRTEAPSPAQAGKPKS